MKILNVDGITLLSKNITECQALSLIVSLELEHSLKPFTDEVKFDYSGRIKNNETAFEVNLKRRDDEYLLVINGSAHKFYHDRNDNDFKESEFLDVKNRLLSSLEQEIYQADQNLVFHKVPELQLTLSKVEIAVNIDIPIDDLAQFLKDNLLLHKNKRFDNSDGITFICQHENYSIKLYPKGKNLLRLEIVLLTRELGKYKIENLNDLTFDKIAPIFERLRFEAKEIIFADGINIHAPQNLTKREKIKMLTYTNEWWHDCLNKNRKASVTKREKKRLTKELYNLKKGCKNILLKKGAGYKDMFIECVDTKIDFVLNYRG